MRITNEAKRLEGQKDQITKRTGSINCGAQMKLFMPGEVITVNGIEIEMTGEHHFISGRGDVFTGKLLTSIS